MQFVAIIINFSLVILYINDLKKKGYLVNILILKKKNKLFFNIIFLNIYYL